MSSMVGATGLGLFLYRPVAWCFSSGDESLSILVVGVALATSVVADQKAEAERLKKETKKHSRRDRKLSARGMLMICPR